jgi:hypothetical protein
VASVSRDERRLKTMGKLAVVDAVVTAFSPEFKTGTLRILSPWREQLGFGYLYFHDSNVETLPLASGITVGRECRCEVWTPPLTNPTSKHRAKNVWFYQLQQTKYSEQDLKQEKQHATDTDI